MISSAFNQETMLPDGMTHFTYDFEDDEQSQQVLWQCYRHYQKALNSSDKGLHCIKGVGITEPTISRFLLGYCDRTLPLKMPSRYSKADRRDQLKMTGFLKPNGHEIFRGCITVPILSKGKLVGGYGRRIAKRIYANSSAHPYHLMNDDTLFNQDCLAHHRSIILTKSPLEALLLIQHGYENVIATIEGFWLNQDHIEKLTAHHIKRVKVMVNLSPYYLNAAQHIATSLHRVGITVKVAQMPAWQDISHLICHHKNAKSLIGKRLHQAVNYQGEGDEI